MGNRPHEKNCPNLPKDTLGAIELAAQAPKLLKDGKTTEAKFAQASERRVARAKPTVMLKNGGHPI